MPHARSRFEAIPRRPLVLPVGSRSGVVSVYLDTGEESEWTVALEAGWLTADPTAGKGPGLITLSTQTNLSAERTALLKVADKATTRELLAGRIVQASAELLDALNTAVLRTQFYTTPRVMELGIAGQCIVEVLQKIPNEPIPLQYIALALVELAVVALGVLAMLWRALIWEVPEPFTWFDASPKEDPFQAVMNSLKSVMPATAIFISTETMQLVAYILEQTLNEE